MRALSTGDVFIDTNRGLAAVKRQPADEAIDRGSDGWGIVVKRGKKNDRRNRMSVKHYDWTAYHAGVRGSKVAIDLDIRRSDLWHVRRPSKSTGWWMQSRVVKGDRVAVLTPNCLRCSRWNLPVRKSVPFVFPELAPHCAGSTYWEIRPQPRYTMPRSRRRLNN